MTSRRFDRIRAVWKPSIVTLGGDPRSRLRRLALAVCCLSLFATGTPAHASLIGFYSFDAGDATDDSGSGNTGTLFGGVSFSAGYEGSAASFGGGRYIELPIDINPSEIPNLTMGAWANVATLTTSTIRTVLNHDNGTWDRAINISNSGTHPWYAHKGASSVAGSNATAGVWEFLAVRYDGTTVQFDVGGTKFTGVDSTDLGSGNDTLWIGGSENFNYFFDGLIDNVFIYDEVLSDAQINAIRIGGAAAILAPEPSTALLLVTGLTGLAIRRRKTRWLPHRSRGRRTLLAATILVLSAPAGATTITTADGLGTDSQIQSGTNADTNYGGSGFFTVKNDCCSGNLHRKAYMRFDLATIGTLSVDAATFSTTVDSGSGSFTYRLYGLLDAHADELWDEGAITWNNAPANSAGATDLDTGAGAVLLATFSSGPAVGSDLTITDSAISTFLNTDTDGVATLMLTRTTSSSFVHSFASKENATYSAPTLTLTLVPEPGTALLLTTGICFVGARRRLPRGRGSAISRNTSRGGH